MNTLNRSILNQHGLEAGSGQRAVTILQIGEGNFLRGFFDWMIQECHKKGLYEGGIAVVQPRPSGKAKIESLAKQDGLYTLVTRGLEDGRVVERSEVVSVFSKVFDPYAEWETFLSMADNPDLQVVVSNTTEAGLVYRPEALEEGKPVQSFPGKIALLLYRRYQIFAGDPAKGLVFLPCELIERNGDELKACVLRYADDWGLPAPFRTWVDAHNRFLNSLVDRIVTGHPGELAEEWFRDWGYRDELVNTAEPYHLWAIEAEPEMERLLPLRQAGLQVHWVSDLRPFQQRKVRILNGAHTLMAPFGIIHGVACVRDMMEHPTYSAWIRDTVEREIIPSLPYPQQEMKAFADAVYERYLNPYIDHKLASIAMNSTSKWKTRLLPTLAHYAETGAELPQGVVAGLAGLLLYYNIRRHGDTFQGTTLDGAVYGVDDDRDVLEAIASIWAEACEQGAPRIETVCRLLACRELWGCDLSEWTGLAQAVEARMNEMEGNR